MYPHFLQFTMPKVGQAAVAVLLYFCFLDSPLLQPLQGWPLLYYLIPLAAVALLRLCDMHTIPVATNIATAEVLIHGLERGDLAWIELQRGRK